MRDLALAPPVPQEVAQPVAAPAPEPTPEPAPEPSPFNLPSLPALRVATGGAADIKPPPLSS